MKPKDIFNSSIIKVFKRKNPYELDEFEIINKSEEENKVNDEKINLYLY